MLNYLLQDLNSLKNPYKAQTLQRFFKTWPWEYWEWDVFLWITVPELKKIAKKYIDLKFEDIQKLFCSKIHEERYLSLAILKLNFLKAKDLIEREKIINFSFKNLWYINNWDLVDSYIPYVFWEYFFDKDRSIIYKLTISDIIWERRVAILTTFYFLRHWDFQDTLKICEILLCDKHDLIQKACGWMLREVGKKDEKVLCDFLEKFHKTMSRTMLRYAIERLDIEKKKYYMKK